MPLYSAQFWVYSDDVGYGAVQEVPDIVLVSQQQGGKNIYSSNLR